MPHNSTDVHRETHFCTHAFTHKARRASQMESEMGNSKGRIVFLTSLCKKFIYAWPKMDFGLLVSLFSNDVQCESKERNGETGTSLFTSGYTVRHI